MRGLMAKPSGEIIETPIHGKLPRRPYGSAILHLDPRRRKSLADTASRQPIPVSDQELSMSRRIVSSRKKIAGHSTVFTYGPDGKR